MSSASIPHHEERGGGEALEERNVIDFDTICFTAFKMNVALHVQFYVFIKKK